MKRYAAALGVALLGALALAAGSGGQGTSFDRVTGTAQATFPNYPGPGLSTTERMTVVADNRGGVAKGVIWFQSRLSEIPRVRVDVTCLVVHGREAWVGGDFERPFLYASNEGLPPIRINQFAMQLVDGGPAGELDGVHPVVFRAVPRPPGYSPCNIQYPLFPLNGGNLIVHDAG